MGPHCTLPTAVSALCHETTVLPSVKQGQTPLQSVSREVRAQLRQQLTGSSSSGGYEEPFLLQRAVRQWHSCPWSRGVTIPVVVPELWGCGSEGCGQWAWGGWGWGSERSSPTSVIPWFYDQEISSTTRLGRSLQNTLRTNQKGPIWEHQQRVGK